MTISPKIPRIASAVAFVMAGFVAASALAGPVVVLPFTAVPLAAGIGILRKRAWSAYGYALYMFAQLILTPFVLIRSGGVTGRVAQIIASFVLMALLGLLFLLAGKSLVAVGSKRGWALPWIAASAAVTVPILFLQAFVIPTGAMEDTLLRGDRILVRCFPEPRFVRGDIVVFRYPVDRRQNSVKRIIGVPGDRIRISGKIVYRNGAALEEPYAVHKTDYTDPYRDNFPSVRNSQFGDHARDMLENHVVNGEIVVPERSYFVLGDNRDASLDSRYWGFVSFSDLIGKPVLIYDSEDRPTDALPDGKGATPRRIRWKRLLKLL